MPSSIVVLAAILLIYIATRCVSTGKRDKVFLALSFLFLFVLSASREFTVGNDMESYLRLFRDSGRLGIDKLAVNKYYEPGFVLLNIILSAINPNPRFFLVVTSAFILFSIYRFIKKESQNYFLSVCIFVGSLLFFTSMNTIRQFTAIAILLFSVDFAKQKRFLPFLLIVLLAASIHTSAILGILFYVVYNVKITRAKIWGSFILSAVITSLAPIILGLVVSVVGRSNYYVKYFDIIHIANVIESIVNTVTFLFCYLVVRRKQKIPDIDRDTSAYLFALLFAMVFSIVAIRVSILDRVATFFQILMFAALPNIILRYIQVQKRRVLADLCIILILAAYSSTIIASRPNWNSAFNYRSCLAPEENYICE